MVEVETPDLIKIRVRVKAANLPDVGKNFARVPARYLKELGISEGELIAVGGAGSTTAVVAYAGRSDEEGLDIIRMDGNIRGNVGVSIDDYVTISKTVASQATVVELSPAGPYHLRGADIFFKRELKGRPISLDDKIPIRAGNRSIEYLVSRIVPDSGTVLVTEETEVRISTAKKKEEKSKAGVAKEIGQRITYEDIGGLKDKISFIREMVELPIRFPELFDRLGISPPKGLLLYGPPGTGKTILARAVATESKAHFMYISGPELLSKYAGESEKKLREFFEEAKKKAPALIFIDEIDSISPRREESSEASSQFVAQLLALMDGIEGRGEVIVIGATNLPNAIDPALRRPGRFDREIEIGVPNKNARKDIFLIHCRHMPLDKSVDINKLAEMTYGFVGADIASLVREAAFRSIRRVLPEVEWESKSIPVKVLDELRVTMNDFMGALVTQKPSAMREVFVDIPDVGWKDVGGLDDVKQVLSETVVWPIRVPGLFKHVGMVPRGVLLFGPTGVGKTLVVRALAHESKFNLISVKGSEFLSKWVGETEHAVRETFRKAKQVAPCIVFFDELDALTPFRKGGSIDSSSSEGVLERVVSTLITEIDSLEDLNNVFIVAATNRPDHVDPALVRPGRFDRLVFIRKPDTPTRLTILQVLTRKLPLSDDADLTKIAEVTLNATGADLDGICKTAAIFAVRSYMRSFVLPKVDLSGEVSNTLIEEILSESPLRIKQRDFLEAIEVVGLPTNLDPRDLAVLAFAQQRGLEVSLESGSENQKAVNDLS